MESRSMPLPGGLPSDPPDLDPAVRAFRLTLALGQRLRTLMDEQLREVGLTTQQATVMSVLEGAGGPLTMSEVAAALGCSHQNARQIVDALQRKGFVEVTTSLTDKRRRAIALTQEAWDFWGSRNEGDADVVAGWFAPLDADERERLASDLARLLGPLLPGAGS